jgi:hypothetical protein
VKHWLKEPFRVVRYEELHDSHRSAGLVRVVKYRTLRWDGHVARMGENKYRILVEKPLGRPRRRC